FTIHASSGCTAEEYHDLCDFPGFQHAFLRIDGSPLAPHLRDSDAAPLGFRMRRSLGHRRAHPSGQHRVGGHPEWPGILGNGACEPDDSMLRGGVGTAGALGFFAGSGTGKDHAAEAALTHAAYRQPRELERPVKIDAHRLAPDLWILLPYELLMSGADTVVDDQHIDRPQAPLGLGHRHGAARSGAEIGGDEI